MVESVAYSVVKVIEGVEIRQYPALVLATVYGMSDDEAFSTLFGYISGQNSGRGRIATTVPVVSVERGERIPMTAPVVSGENSFSFVLPSSFTAETAPRPLDERANVVGRPEMRVAVLRFRGTASDRRVKKKTLELLGALRRQNITAKGEPFLMRYNPPFIPGIFRRNEVGVEVAV